LRWTLGWRGLDATRLELVWAERVGDGLRARGTQLGTEPQPYELHYELVGGFLRVRIDGRAIELELADGADFFDLGSSPLFNSLPIIRHGLHRGGEPRDFVMTWVSVPGLEVSRSEQRYEPLAPGLVRFSEGSFTADLEIDEDGFVVRYPGFAERVGLPHEGPH
jgi:hypothetical protein